MPFFKAFHSEWCPLVQRVQPLQFFPKNKGNLFGIFNISQALNRKFNYTLLIPPQIHYKPKLNEEALLFLDFVIKINLRYRTEFRP